MAKAQGFAVILSTERMDKFLACVNDDLPFAEPVPEFQHSRNAPLICFIINKGKLTHIGLGRRGMRAGTGLSRLNIYKTEKLAVSLSVQKILNQLPKRNAAFLRKRFQSGGLLPEKSFVAVVKTILQIAPHASDILEHFSPVRIDRIQRLSSRERVNLAQHKEALLTALFIANISRHSVQKWMPPEDKPVSFLDGLPNVRLCEDPMVINDFLKLPKFQIIKILPYPAVVFESDKNSDRLTVIFANRLPLEKQTGTDLIYFNETYQSFIMVQYKAMKHEKAFDKLSEAVFRLPNAQLKKEIERMDTMLSLLKTCTPNENIGGFRLTENPFFLKLCSKIEFDPDDVGLTPGMYLPLDYWKLLENDAGIKGPKGGLRITYKNVQRYFDNTAFTAVVSKAWVGSTPSQSQILEKIINETLQTGKAVVLAIKTEESLIEKNFPNHFPNTRTYDD